MDGTVDASVAVKRTSTKQNGQATPHARPPAASLSTDNEYKLLSNLPGPASGAYLKTAVTLLETRFGDQLFKLYAGWQSGLCQIFEVRSQTGPYQPLLTPLGCGTDLICL